MRDLPDGGEFSVRIDESPFQCSPMGREDPAVVGHAPSANDVPGPPGLGDHLSVRLARSKSTVPVAPQAPRAVVCRATAAALVIVSVLAATVLAAVPRATAHPFGEPQVADVGLDPDRNDVVVVNWQFGMEDDLTLLAYYLGLVDQDRVMLDGAIFYDPTDSRSLEQSTEFDDYLLQHIKVTTTNGACHGAVADKSDVQAIGATVEFTCSSPVESATVAVTMLTDLHPEYKTLASGPSGQSFVYEDDNTNHAWSFDPAASETTGPDLAWSAAVQIILVLGAVAVVVITGVMWYRRQAPKHSKCSVRAGL